MLAAEGAPPPSGQPVRVPFPIAPAHSHLHPGETTALTAVRHAAVDRRALQSGFREFRALLVEPGSIDRVRGIDSAPPVVGPPGCVVRATHLRGIKPDLDSAQAIIQLDAGDLSGAVECIGPGQSGLGVGDHRRTTVGFQARDGGGPAPRDEGRHPIPLPTAVRIQRCSTR